MAREKILYYQFSPNIPWKFITGVIAPVVSKEVWTTRIKTSRSAIILMPGYLLEIITTLMAPKILKDNGVTISKWIVPRYYDSLLNFFNVKTKNVNNDSIVSEQKRLGKVIRNYPVPIFLDKDNNIYFNLLNNYGGNRFNINGSNITRLEAPFWKQSLLNTCCNTYFTTFPKFSLEELSSYKNDFFKSKGINVGKYIVIDNFETIKITADRRELKHKIYIKEEINDLAFRLKKNNIKCIVLSKEENNNSDNVIYLDSWDKIDSLNLISILVGAECIISSDPNIYLSAALLGCKKIITSDNPPKGWTFNDIPNNFNRDVIWHSSNIYGNDYIYDVITKEINGR